MIIKNTDSNNFTNISNIAINDIRLSSGALSTLSYLISKPSEWKVYATEISVRFKCDRRTSRRYIDELIASGYMKQNSQVCKDGKTSYDYDVTDNPSNITSVQKMYNCEKKMLKINSNVKNCINDLQMYMDMYSLIPSEPIKNIKSQIKLIVSSEIISPKIFALFGLDWMHGMKPNQIVNMQTFISDAINMFNNEIEIKKTPNNFKYEIECED